MLRYEEAPDFSTTILAPRQRDGSPHRLEEQAAAAAATTMATTGRSLSRRPAGSGASSLGKRRNLRAGSGPCTCLAGAWWLRRLRWRLSRIHRESCPPVVLRPPLLPSHVVCREHCSSFARRHENWLLAVLMIVIIVSRRGRWKRLEGGWRPRASCRILVRQ